MESRAGVGDRFHAVQLKKNYVGHSRKVAGTFGLCFWCLQKQVPTFRTLGGTFPANLRLFGISTEVPMLKGCMVCAAALVWDITSCNSWIFFIVAICETVDRTC